MDIKEYTISNEILEVKFLNLGAVITEINFKGINRVLKFKDLTAYLDNTMYLGATVGRTAGRIKNGTIEQGQLCKNFLGKHNLHGNNLHQVFYDVKLTQDSAKLSYTDPEGEYPGNLQIEIQFKIENNKLIQTIDATSDKPTLINFTNHTYFNLNGTGKMLTHELMIDSNSVAKLNEEYIIDDFVPVENTAFDFNQSHPILDALIKGDKQFLITGFIDHPYQLEGNLQLKGDDCMMVIDTNQKFLVAYLGSQIANESNKLENNINENYVGLCLETQKCPGDLEMVTEYAYKTAYTFS